MNVEDGAKEALLRPSNVNAFEAVVAKLAEAIEPDSVTLPDAMMFPVTVRLPVMYGELSIICYSIYFYDIEITPVLNDASISAIK